MIVSSCGWTGFVADRRLIIWRDLPKSFLPQIFGGVREKSVAPHSLAEPFASAGKPGSESEAFFCHISWRQAHGGHTRAKRGKKATPRYVAGPFTPLCRVYRDFGGIRAILSGGNPPRYKTNHNKGSPLLPKWCTARRKTSKSL